jgi:hypothetical protein
MRELPGYRDCLSPDSPRIGSVRQHYTAASGVVLSGHDRLSLDNLKLLR